MSAIHDETRARWEQMQPEKFIQLVLHGALREKINTAYMVIHVYAQIVHQLPATATMRLEVYGADDEDGEIGLRDLFMQMRDSIAAVHDVNEDDTPTQPKKQTPGDSILRFIRRIRPHMTAIRQCIQPVQADARIRQAALPGLSGRRVGDITAEILKHVTDIEQILDFAQNYAENITHQARSS